jgi:hypothetical protein
MCVLESDSFAGHQWFTPVILATQEAEIRRIEVRSQPKQIVWRLEKNPSQKRAGGVAQGVSPEFKTQNLQKKKKAIVLSPCPTSLWTPD